MFITIAHHLTVSMSLLMLYQVVVGIQMVPSFNMLLPHAMASSVHRTRPTKWCPVLYARSNQTTDSVTADLSLQLLPIASYW
jgi:hypothetical protein